MSAAHKRLCNFRLPFAAALAMVCGVAAAYACALYRIDYLYLTAAAPVAAAIFAVAAISRRSVKTLAYIAVVALFFAVGAAYAAAVFAKLASLVPPDGEVLVTTCNRLRFATGNMRHTTRYTVTADGRIRIEHELAVDAALPPLARVGTLQAAPADDYGAFLWNNPATGQTEGRTVEWGEGYVLVQPSTGKQVGPVCEAIDRYSDGLYAVQQNGLWGYLDIDGTQVIPCQYQQARPFCSNLAAVQNTDGLWGYISLAGTVKVPFQYLDAAQVLRVQIDRRQIIFAFQEVVAFYVQPAYRRTHVFDIPFPVHFYAWNLFKYIRERAVILAHQCRDAVCDSVLAFSNRRRGDDGLVQLQRRRLKRDVAPCRKRRP